MVDPRGRVAARTDLFEGTVLVALTGYGTEDDRRRSLAAGFDEHLVKPPSVDSLRQSAAHPRLFELDCQQS